MRSLRKIPTRLRGTDFCTSSVRFAPSFVSNQTVPNAPELYKVHQNISLGSNGVDRVRSLRKIPTQLRGTNFCTRSARFPPSFVRHTNSPEWYEMHQNITFGSNGVDRVPSLRKILTRLRGTKVCTS